jgi:putative restriction endonuclease
MLRASHIKPWSDCSNRERLDPLNGLLLVAHIDALFDNGLWFEV